MLKNLTEKLVKSIFIFIFGWVTVQRTTIRITTFWRIKFGEDNSENDNSEKNNMTIRKTTIRESNANILKTDPFNNIIESKNILL